jgi:hypothetical protein
MKNNRINAMGGLLFPLVFSLVASASTQGLAANHTDLLGEPASGQRLQLAANHTDLLGEPAIGQRLQLAANRTDATGERIEPDYRQTAISDLSKSFAQMRMI